MLQEVTKRVSSAWRLVQLLNWQQCRKRFY